MPPEKPVLIIGAGPAGITAALQLKRCGWDFHWLEKGDVGGLIRGANLVENLPGFPGGIPGRELSERFSLQIRQAGIFPISAEVIRLVYDGSLFIAETRSAAYCAGMAVVASGSRGSRLPVANTAAGVKDRIVEEITPLLPVEGRHIVIVGGGDLAFDYALTLSRRNQVTILVRGGEVRCLPLLYERANTGEGIQLHHETSIERIECGRDGLMLLACKSPQGELLLEADYLLPAIGREGNQDFLDAALLPELPRLEAQGLIHFAGDVKNGIYRQVSIAMGDGMLAAMKINQKLKGNCK